MFPLGRIVAAPKEFSEVLDLCADFVRGAVRRGGGNVLVFPPGFDAIRRLRSMLKELMEKRDGRYQTQILHSFGGDERSGLGSIGFGFFLFRSAADVACGMQVVQSLSV